MLCWTDTDWTSDLLNRQTRTDLLITINCGPIAQTPKLQSATAQTTAEAEFNALAYLIKELKFVRSVLMEIRCINFDPIRIMQGSLV